MPRRLLFTLLLIFALLAASPLAFAQETTTVPAVDTVPPVITVPANIVVDAVDATGTIVTYILPVAIDGVDGPVAVVCDFPPGTLFPLGETIVTCGASDAAGNHAAITFTVTVIDETPPTFDLPANVAVAANDASGAVVSYAISTAYDNVDGSVAVGCDIPTGALFPLGTTLVTCSAQDASGNSSAVSFNVTVLDQTPPIIDVPANIIVDAPDQTGAIVNYTPPAASDNVDGWIAARCDLATGSLFPVGTTFVTCSAQDSSGNMAAPVSFSVTVNQPPPPPTETPPPTAIPTDVPTAVSTPVSTAVPTTVPTSIPTAVSTDVPTPQSPPTLTATTTTTPAPSPGATATMPAATTPPVIATIISTGTHPPAQLPTPVPTEITRPEPPHTLTPVPWQTPPPYVEPSPTIAPAPAREALDLPPLPPQNFVIVTDGGPLNGLAEIWNYKDFPISQEFGHTEFSVVHFGWYSYGIAYGLDGYEHHGIDVGMPAGTWLYSPIEGTVKISGDTPYYTFYGNGQPNVGELLIETDNGDEVILGHMGRIAVNVGDRVKIGQFVGLSGGDNGDHVHLEVREHRPGGWLQVVDPRKSFLIAVLKDAARKHGGNGGHIPQRPSPDGPWYDLPSRDDPRLQP